MVGNGLGARNGILFKTAASLEEAGKVQIVALDKTGTITSGEPVVTDLVPAEGISEKELLEMALALEAKSEHPLARAVLKKGKELSLKMDEVSDFTALPGNGLSAALGGKRLLGGSMSFIGEKLPLPKEMKHRAEELAENGKTPLLFAEDDRLLGIIAVADTIKEDSSKAVRQLQGLSLIHI